MFGEQHSGENMFKLKIPPIFYVSDERTPNWTKNYPKETWLLLFPKENQKGNTFLKNKVVLDDFKEVISTL